MNTAVGLLPESIEDPQETTSLLEKFAQGPQKKKNLCSVGKVIETLAPAEQEAVKTAFADPEWSASSIFEIFSSEDYSISYDSVKVHKRKACICLRGRNNS